MIKTILVPEQKEAVERLLSSRRVCVADPVGFGKTLSVLAAFDELKAKGVDTQMLILATSTAMVAWVEQIPGHTDMTAVYGDNYNVEETYRRVREEDPDIVVLSYTTITERTTRDKIVNGKVVKEGKRYPAKYIDLIVEMYEKRPTGVLLVLEEAHNTRNPGSKRRNIVEKLIACSQVVWPVTATPMTKDLTDIYHMMHLMIPNFFGSMDNFLKNYTVRVQKQRWDPRRKRQVPYKQIVSYKNLDHLNETIAPYFIRRERELDVSFEPVYGNFNHNEFRLYLRAAAGLIGIEDYSTASIRRNLEEELKDPRAFGARLPDLQRVVDGSIDGDRSLWTGALTSKENVLVSDLTNSFKQEGKAAVVYCYYSHTYARLKQVLEDNLSAIGANRLYTLSVDNGTTTSRLEIQNSFDHGDLLLMTSVGRESLSLRRCDEMHLYNIPDSAGDVVQVAGRLTRRDSEYQSFRIRIPVIRDSIDEYKVAKLLSRAKLIESVVGGEATLPPGGELLAPDDLLKMRRGLLWKVA